ncbi:MAG: hypothetical protein JSU73_05985 [candidate division WOR-3 bacterium]|nr:MAG: hypothetical protein JSU73_05985 [candidate division WOR-3 bacterium]
MSKRLLLACLLVVGMISSAYAEDESALELVSKVGEDLLEDYARPLIASYGVAMGTGLYNSAASHKFLGFDVGLRVMAIKIPTEAKTFTAVVKVCSLNTKFGRIDTFQDTITAATIFGKRGIDTTWIPPNAIGIPPGMPGGLGLNYMPFLVPQAAVGLPVPGMELMVRYVPWPFKGELVHFLGLGLQQNLSAVTGVGFADIALQGFLQKFIIGDAMNATTFGGNLHLSKTFLTLTPYAGIGFDNTSMKIKYDFKVKAPKFVPGVPPRMETEEVTIPVDFDYSSGINWRTTLGARVKLGLMFLNLDYNRDLTNSYDAFSLGTGISIR